MASRQTVDDTPWLSGQERAAWMMVVALLVKLPGAIEGELQRSVGLSLFEYSVLAGLSEAPGRSMQMTELAFFANGSLSRLSHVVRRLEARDLVARHPDPDDGRRTHAVLTDEGWNLVVAAAPGHVRQVRADVLDVLSPTQLRSLGALASRLMEHLDPTVHALLKRLA